MTWLGKILTMVVLLVSLVGVWMTALAWSTRTNWKTSSDKYSAALKESETERKREYDASQARVADLTAQLAEAKKSADSYADLANKLAVANQQVQSDVGNVSAKINQADIVANVLQANLKAAQDELDATRKRNDGLENTLVRKSIELEKAKTDQAAAEADAKQARSQADDAQKKVDSLTAQVNELKRSGGTGSGLVENFLAGSANPPLEGTRGTVTGYSEGLVSLSIGLDAGLVPGQTLDIYRLEGGGKYLGTVVVTDVRPKAAVASFKPAYGKPMNRLKPDELPKIGDKVEPGRTALR